MTVNQVHALFVVVLFLGSVIVALWGAEIAGGAAGAWARGSAQAAAEKKWRRANAASAGKPDEEFAAEQTAARRTRARPESTAARRILGAAAAGWRLGSRGAARATAAARRRRLARRGWTVGADGTARPPGSSGSQSGSRRPGGSPGPRTRTRRRSRFRPGRKLGVCARCGLTAGAASLDALKVCFLCRRKKTEKTPQDPAGSAPETQTAGATSSPPAGTLIPAGPVPESLPAPDRTPVPGTAPRVPAMAGATATAITSPTGRTVMAAGIGSGRPGSALATRPGTGVTAGRGAVATRPSGGVAVRGDAADHGEWVEHAKIIVKYVSDMFAFVKTMTEDMGRGECPAELIDETAAWAEMIYAYGTQILAELIQINKDIKPWIDAVTAQGGPQNVASPRWLEGGSRRQLQAR